METSLEKLLGIAFIAVMYSFVFVWLVKALVRMIKEMGG